MPLVDRDDEHLKLLTLTAYILGGFHALCALFPIIHVMLGLAMLMNPHSFCKPSHDCPPSFIGWFFVGIGGFIMLLGLLYGASQILLGRLVAKRKRWLICMVLAGLACAAFPFGTALGILVFIVLSRDSVKARFKSVPLPESPLPGTIESRE